MPIRSNCKFDVYRIPIEYLVPNVLNDRIAWRIREFEAENNRKLSSDNEQDINLVYELLLKESPKDNNNTMKDLVDNGQLVDGIITNDGIIIDGNRRATLIRELFKGAYSEKYHQNIEDFRFFNAVILTEEISDKEIMALETRIQIGEDKKLDYNPICVYIKVDNLSNAGYNEKQIASYMNISETNVKERKEVFSLMKEYLYQINKPNHFTLLEGLEDQFLNTKLVFKKLDNKTYSTYDNWNYSDTDVTCFKQVCYDYMRAKFEGKKYRDILVGKVNKTNGVFIKKDVWDEFYKNHENIIEKNNPQSEQDWEMLGKKFAQNLNNANSKLCDVLNERSVSSLVSSISSKVETLKNCLLDSEELKQEDYESLKNSSKIIYQIIKDF